MMAAPLIGAADAILIAPRLIAAAMARTVMRINYLP